MRASTRRPRAAASSANPTREPDLREVGLEAPAIAAAAAAAPGPEDHVAELAAVAGCSAVDLAAEDQSRADAAAEGEKKERGGAARRADPGFGQGVAVARRCRRRRGRRGLSELALDRQSGESRQVGAAANDAAMGDAAGNADTDRAAALVARAPPRPR